MYNVYLRTIFRILHCACAEKLIDKAEFCSFLADFSFLLHFLLMFTLSHRTEIVFFLKHDMYPLKHKSFDEPLLEKRGFLGVSMETQRNICWFS